MARSPLYLVVRTLAILWLFSVLGFSLLISMPGDPLDRMLEDNPDFTFEDYQRLRAIYGLDDPVYIRYFKWASQGVQGQLGYSRQYKIPVQNLVFPRIQNTLILVTLALVISLVGGLLLGGLLALTRHWLIDIPIRALILLDSSVPGFWLGLLMIVLFSVNLHWLPPGGIMSSDVQPGTWNQFADRVKYVVMPVFVLSLIQMAAWARYARNNMASVEPGVESDFAATFRKWLADVLCIVGVRFAPLLGVVAIVEAVFSYPGIGKLLYDSVMGNDFVVSVGILMTMIYLSVVARLVGDLIYWSLARARAGEHPDTASAVPASGRGAVQSSETSRRDPSPATVLRGIAVLSGMAAVGTMLFFSYIGPSTSPYQPDQVNLRERFARPISVMVQGGDGQPNLYDEDAIKAATAERPLKDGHRFGTDDLGRDAATRAMYGGRTTLTIGLIVAIYGVFVAAAFGFLAAVSGPLWDYIADPVVAFRDALPDLPVLLVLAKIFPPGFITVCVLLILLNRVGGVRFTPGLFGRRNQPLDDPGGPKPAPPRSTPREIILNGLSGLGVAAAVYWAWAVVLETTVSWLGLGIQPPMPSWGNMLSNAQQYFFSAPWLVFYPGACIFLTVLGLNLVADGLRRVPGQGGIGR